MVATLRCPTCNRTFKEGEQIQPGRTTCPYDGTALESSKKKPDDEGDKAA